jgi:hypothetical protein
MPRTRFDRYAAPKRPDADPIKAVILERMHALGIRNHMMARAMLISEGAWYARKKAPTTEWTLGELIRAATYLGIEPEELREGIRYRI